MCHLMTIDICLKSITMFKKNDNQIKRQINYNYNTQSLINELINIMIKVSFYI